LQCAANRARGEKFVHWKLFKTNFSGLVDSPPSDSTDSFPMVEISLNIRKIIDLVSNKRSLLCRIW